MKFDTVYSENLFILSNQTISHRCYYRWKKNCILSIKLSQSAKPNVILSSSYEYNNKNYLSFAVLYYCSYMRVKCKIKEFMINCPIQINKRHVICFSFSCCWDRCLSIPLFHMNYNFSRFLSKFNLMVSLHVHDYIDQLPSQKGTINVRGKQQTNLY